MTWKLQFVHIFDTFLHETHEKMCYFFSVVICTGTQNGLSMTGTLENQYKLIQQYMGCEIVMGNLEIIMMEHTRDFSFLQVSFCTALLVI